MYLRFDTKVRLFQRVIETAIVGDLDELPLPERDWSIRSFTAPTLAERIAAFADGVATMNERLGPLMAVNGEVEVSEADVQRSAGEAREATLVFLRTFWEGAERDGILPSGADREWLIATSAILSAAETRLHITRALGWDRSAYRDWLEQSWHRLAAGASAEAPGP